MALAEAALFYVDEVVEQGEEEGEDSAPLKSREDLEAEVAGMALELEQLSQANEQLTRAKAELESRLRAETQALHASKAALTELGMQHEAAKRGLLAEMDEYAAQMEAKYDKCEAALHYSLAATKKSGFFFSQNLPPSAPTQREASTARISWQKLASVHSPRPTSPPLQPRPEPPLSPDAAAAVGIRKPVVASPAPALLASAQQQDTVQQSRRLLAASPAPALLVSARLQDTTRKPGVTASPVSAPLATAGRQDATQ